MVLVQVEKYENRNKNFYNIHPSISYRDIFYQLYLRASYVSTKFINGFLPFLILLLPFTTISFRKCKKEISNHKARFGTFLLIFVPVIAMVIFTISKKFEFSLSFFLPLAGALIVGVNEELVYRGVVLTNFADEKGRMRGTFSLSYRLFPLARSKYPGRPISKPSY